MVESPGQAGAESQGGDALQSLRERVLRAALTVLAFAVPGISLVIIIVSLTTRHLDPMTVALSAYTLVFPVLRLLHPHLSFRTSAIALLVLMAVTGFVVAARGGVGNGNILLNALVLLLGALFFGRRGAAVGLLVVVILFVLAGVLVLGGYVPPVTKSMWDSTTPGFWLRESIALALVGLAVLVAQVYVVERLATEARRLEGLVVQEQEQRLALERAEHERECEREQLSDAQRALEESRRIEALARMAGGIAHDFNNSLTVIMGAAESVKLADSPAEAGGCADEIIAGARQAAELTRKLLTLGRQQVASPQPVLLAPLFERLQAAFRRVLPDDIVLDMPVPAGQLTAHVDPTELERALFNLMLNARDAMPKGGHLRVECSGQAIDGEDVGLLPGRYIELHVTDTGLGIPPETIDHIFEPFFTTKSVATGSGLGLATVYAFARESGGMLRVESSPGAGTTFTLFLLEAREAAAATGPARPASPAPEDFPAGTRVLVVEDNPIVRENMVTILRRDRCEVTEAGDGDQAKALIAAGTEFSVLCIDGVMPGASTREVIADAERRLPNVRVLLCSGYLREELLRRGVATGRYSFLPKPFSARELVSAVRGLVASSG
jgi:signal transduction histidine kinase/CheY-like chemotaxis protein